MNIIYHHRTQGKGVEGIHIRNIINEFVKLHHSVTVISPPGCDPMNESVKKDTPKRLSLFRIFFSHMSKRCPEIPFELAEMGYNLYAFFKIYKEITKGRIDLIYERYFLFSFASMIIARRYHIPIIYEVNDSGFVPRLRKLKLRRIAYYFERKAFLTAVRLITVSDQFKRILVNAGIPEKKIMVCHNAIDPDIFNPFKVNAIELGISSEILILGFVGLFVKWVGLDLLLNTFLLIHSQYPQIFLLLVGSGPEEEKIRELINRFELQSHIMITGKIPHTEVPAYIKKMDICIIPKHERYTSPVKLFEYMAMGKAVLVPAYESMREIIQHGENGMFFEPDNFEGLVRVLQDMIRNRELLSFLGKNARAYVLANHTWHKNVIRIEREMLQIVSIHS